MKNFSCIIALKRNFFMTEWNSAQLQFSFTFFFFLYMLFHSLCLTPPLWKKKKKNLDIFTSEIKTLTSSLFIFADKIYVAMDKVLFFFFTKNYAEFFEHKHVRYVVFPIQIFFGRKLMYAELYYLDIYFYILIFYNMLFIHIYSWELFNVAYSSIVSHFSLSLSPSLPRSFAHS
jgi:hypothetical protein